LRPFTAGSYSGPMDDLSQQLADLARRVRALEDELAIHRQIVRYGFAVDSGDADRAAALFTPDTVYDVDGPLRMEGRDGVRAMVNGPRHRAMLPNCAHQIGPAVVEPDGDRAHAVGYSRVYVRGPAGIGIYRVSANRWELERHDGAWLVARRTARLVGHPDATGLLRGDRE
jgi:ketosteroid isomerase-like protein